MQGSLLFKMEIVGRGGVNYDSNDQKYAWNRMENVPYVSEKNVSFHKGRYYKNANGKLEKKLSISSDCLLHHMYAETQTSANANVMHDFNTLMNYVSSPTAIERGYMFADHNMKRTSAIRIIDAIQSCNAVPTLECFSRSGEKNTKTSETDVSDNTFFFKENVGDITYKTMGSIDFDLLRFIAMSEVHGRLAINPDYAELYRKLLGNKLGSEVPEPKYYHASTHDEFPEFGILLTDAQVRKLVNDIITKLAHIQINKRSAYAMVSELKVKLVNDPIYDTFDDEEGWITIKSPDTRFSLNNLIIEPKTRFVEVNVETARKTIETVETELKKMKEEKKEKKESKKKTKTEPTTETEG